MTDLQPSEECAKEVTMTVLTVPVSNFVYICTVLKPGQLSLQLSYML